METLVHSASSQCATKTDKLVAGPYALQNFEAWQFPGLSPPPAEATKLLQALAADRAIQHIMTTHRLLSFSGSEQAQKVQLHDNFHYAQSIYLYDRFRVGLLKEMPPEGRHSFDSHTAHFFSISQILIMYT